jgi:thiamine-phosphate pyrophosphorylase
VTAFRRGSITLVTDRHQLAPDARTTAAEVAALEAFLDAAIDAEIDYIQFRESDLGARALVGAVTRVAERTAGTSTRVIVNDRADVALAGAAHGVHVRGDGPPVALIRALSDAWIVGRSVHADDDLVCLAGADYGLFGTVFPSHSKAAGHRAAGVDALARAAASTTCPVVAIGGITPENAARALAAGAAAIAAIGVFLPEGRSPDALGVRRAVAAFRARAAGLSRSARA